MSVPQHVTNTIKLQDEVVVVTGASSGIGEAVAWQFAMQGCKVQCIKISTAYILVISSTAVHVANCHWINRRKPKHTCYGPQKLHVCIATTEKCPKQVSSHVALTQLKSLTACGDVNSISRLLLPDVE